MRWAPLSMLLLAGCAHVGPDGKPRSAVKWCARGPVPVTLLKAGKHTGRDSGLFVVEVRACMRLLARESAFTEYDDGPQRTLFGLTTNAHGLVTDVCLLGTTLDPTMDFLECVSTRVMSSRSTVEANQQEASWSVVTVLD